MTKVKKITVSNLKAVSKLEADFNGCTAIITGGNNKGKSSFLRSLPERLRGNKPEMILKHGESEGRAEWELTTGEKFVWEFDGKKEKLTYISDKNIPAKITKEISSTYFPDVFDVDKFLQDAPAKQRATLQKISGIDFTEIDRLYKEAYENRAYANKRVVETKAKLKFYDPKIPTELYPTDDLEKELNSIGEHNLRFETVAEKLKEKVSQKDNIIIEIQDLQDKIKILQNQITVLDSDIEKGNKWLNEDKNKKKENRSELESNLFELTKKNDEIQDNLIAKKLHDEYEEAVNNAKAADDEVKKIESDKADALKSSSLPDGFGITDDGITYNGYSFDRETLSSSGIYIGALKLAATQLGEVKTLYFDASFLDKNSLSEIEQWANSQDLQLLIERPDFEGGDIEYQIVHK